MVGRERFYSLDRLDDRLRHRSVHWIPSRTVVRAEGFRQFGVGDSRSIKLPLEDNKNEIASPGDMLLCVRQVRQHKLLPESMCH
jgi:hypothetical protein